MNIFSFVKSRVSILDAISEYVTLKKAGTYFKGRCPFHHEKTGSFTVSPHREIFYCFGCHKGGDIIAFIALAERCGQLEAAQHLVEQHNLEVPATITWEKTEHTGAQSKRYTTLCMLIAQWCNAKLLKTPSAWDYLKNRSITDAAIDQFQVGYFPETEVAELISFVKAEGFIVADLLSAHILFEGKFGLYSPFSDRIIIPIRDHLGRPCGFGGRVFRPGDDRAKYYNSQDHAFFNKGTMLFGLDLAKKDIQEKQVVFLVEGYFDVIAMVQAGYRNTVASMGTATTQEQLKMVARYAQKMIVLYDGDTAGQTAMMKLTHLAWLVNMDLEVLTLPAASDPASYLEKHKTLDAILSTTQDIFVYFIHRISQGYSAKPMQERIKLIQELVGIIAVLDDPLKQNFLLQKASTVFDIPLDVLRQQTKKHAPTHYQDSSEQPEEIINIPHTPTPLEMRVITSLINKHLIAKEDLELIQRAVHPDVGALIENFLIYNKESDVFNFSNFLDILSNDQRELATRIVIEAEKTEALSLDEVLTSLWKKEWKMILNTVKLELKTAEAANDITSVVRITTEFNAHKNKMKEKGIL